VSGTHTQIREYDDGHDKLPGDGHFAGCSHHTVAGYVAARGAGGLCDAPAARPQLVDEFLPKVEEWMERSAGKIRADKAHAKDTNLREEYASFAELEAACALFCGHPGPVTPPRPSSSPRPRAPGVWLTEAVTTTKLVGAGDVN